MFTDTMKINFKYKTIFLLVLIFLLGVFLRFYKLGEYPVGFHIDEASIGYNAFSLFTTGKDDNGNFLPIYIDQFGDYRLAGYHYLAIVPVVLLGLTHEAARLPGALLGSLTVISFYYLAFVLFRDKKLSIIASLLLAVAPWSIVFSRTSSEGLVGVFFVVTGFAFILSGIQTKKTHEYILGASFLFGSFFFYHSQRIFVPVFLFFLIIYFCFSSWKKILTHKKLVITTLMLSFISFSLIFFIKGGTGRFSQVNIFGSFETNFQLTKEIQDDALAKSPFFISRFFHNKITNILYMFTSNYLDYFSFNYIFTKGGLPLWYSIPRAGLVNIIEFPFILYGIFSLLYSNKKLPKIAVLWLLVGPLVAAVTIDDIPNTQRSIVMFPAFHLLSAAGFVQFITLFRRWKFPISILCGLLLLVNVLYFLNQYFFNAKTNKPWYRNNGFAEMMSVVNKNYNNYDNIVMTKTQGGTYPLVLFYSKFNPKKYQDEGSPKTKDYSGFGKFIFHPHNCPFSQSRDKLPKVEKILFVESGECLGENLKTEKYTYIYREDGTKAFRIVF